MPKPASYPTLYDDVKKVNISFLKKHEYFNPNIIRSGVITWSRCGNKTGSISIIVNVTDDNSYLELDYICNGEPINYRVKLIQVPSNLGNGYQWLFECPRTRLLCRNLYQVQTYFWHRTAFNGSMYESQTKSKKWRIIEKIYGSYFDLEKNCDILYRKHLKKSYAGKPTKIYAKVSSQIKRAERFDHRDIEMLMMM